MSNPTSLISAPVALSAAADRLVYGHCTTDTRFYASYTADGASFSNATSSPTSQTYVAGQIDIANDGTDFVAVKTLASNLSCLASKLTWSTKAFGSEDTVYAPSNAVGGIAAKIVRRSSDYVVLHEDDSEKVMGTNYSRIAVSYGTPGSWTKVASGLNAGNASDAIAYALLKDSTHRCQVVWSVSTGNRATQSFGTGNTFTGASTGNYHTGGTASQDAIYQGQWLNIADGTARILSSHTGAVTNNFHSATDSATPTWSTTATFTASAVQAAPARALRSKDTQSIRAYWVASNEIRYRESAAGGATFGSTDLTFASTTDLGHSAVASDNIRAVYWTINGEPVNSVIYLGPSSIYYHFYRTAYFKPTNAALTITGQAPTLKLGIVRAVADEIKYQQTASTTSARIGASYNDEYGQAYTFANSFPISKIQASMSRVGAATGNVVVNIYKVEQGTVGTDAVPSNGASPVATSDAVDASTISSSQGFVTFPFSGAVALPPGDYVFSVAYAGGSGVIYLNVFFYTGGAPGNVVSYDAGAWAADATRDLTYRVYGTSGLGFQCYAPTPRIGKTIAVDNGAISFTGNAPTLSPVAHPAEDALAITGYAPTLAFGVGIPAQDTPATVFASAFTNQATLVGAAQTYDAFGQVFNVASDTVVSRVGFWMYKNTTSMPNYAYAEIYKVSGSVPDTNATPIAVSKPFDPNQMGLSAAFWYLDFSPVGLSAGDYAVVLSYPYGDATHYIRMFGYSLETQITPGRMTRRQVSDGAWTSVSDNYDIKGELYEAPYLSFAGWTPSLGIGIPVITGGAGETDASQTGTDDGNDKTDSGNYEAYAQVFTSTVGGPLREARFKVAKTGTPNGALVAKLYNVTGTPQTAAPTGVAIATAYLNHDSNDITGTPTVFSWLFDESVSLSPGTLYAISLEDQSTNTDGSTIYYEIRKSITNVYSDGNTARYNGAWNNYTGDYYFEAITNRGLVFTGYVPTVSVEAASATFFPANGAINFTTYAPSAEISYTFTPGEDALVITGFAPSVGIDVSRAPGNGSLTITGLAPSAEISYVATPGEDALTITGLAPSLLVNVIIPIPAPVSAIGMLAHYDGADAATSTSDEIPGVTHTLSGSAELDTATQKFGTASLRGPATNAQDLVTGITLDETQNWTLEGFQSQDDTNEIQLTLEDGSNNQRVRLFTNDDSGQLTVTLTDSGGGTIWTTTVTPAFPGGWRHWAVVREGTTYSLYWNGNRVATTTSSTNIGPIVQARLLTFHVNPATNVWFDETRVTQAAEYSGTTYTVPTAAFSTPFKDGIEITTYAPSLVTMFVSQPGTDDLTITGFAPTVSQSFVETPTNGAINFTGLAPSAEVSYTLSPAEDALTITGFAPAVMVGALRLPDQYDLTITTYAPTAFVQMYAQPGVGTVTITGLAPTATQNIIIQIPFPAVGDAMLAHYNGTDAATTTTDEVAGVTHTLSGGIELDTAHPKFGSAALRWTANGGQDLVTGVSFDETGNWTLEGWNRSSDTNIREIRVQNGSSQDGIMFRVDHDSTNIVLTLTDSGGSTIWTVTVDAPATITMDWDTWYHWAVVREGTAYSLYWNGTRVGTTTSATNVRPSTQVRMITTFFVAATEMEEDEVRLSHEAKYSGASLTEPTAEFTVQTSGTPYPSFTTYAPSAELDYSFAIDNAALTITGQAPQALTGYIFTPGEDVLVITGFAPSIESSVTVTPGEDALTITGLAPTLVVGVVAQPAEDALVITGFSPSSEVSYVLSPAEDALVITGLAPSLLVGVIVQPGNATLTITGFAPDAVEFLVTSPANASLTLTGFAPVVSASVTFTPGEDALQITGQAPSAEISYTIEVNVNALTLTGYAPTLSEGVVAQPGAGSLTITGEAPSAEITYTIAVGPDTLVFTGLSPFIGGGLVVMPDEDALVITGLAPSAEITYTIAVAEDALTFTGFAPQISTSVVAQPNAGTLTVTGFAPDAVEFLVVSPTDDALVITGLAPTVSVNLLAQPGNASLTITGLAPSAERSYVFSPANDALVFTGEAPVAQSGDSHTVQPGTGSATFTGLAPSVEISYTLSPANGSVTVTGLAPSVEIDYTIEITPGALTVTGFAPSIGGGIIALPGEATLTITGFTPSIAADVFIPVPLISKAHRYWRVAYIRLPDTATHLEISELQFLENGANVTGSGTKSSSDAPSVGTLSSLFDSDLGTRCAWTAAVADDNLNFWIQIDFGGGNEKEINGIKQGGYDTSDRYMWDFSLQYSDDGTNFYVLGSQKGLTYPGNSTLSSEYPFDPITSNRRYWRWHFFANNDATYTSLNQVELRASLGGADVIPTGSASARFPSPDHPNNAVDNDYTNTEWVGLNSNLFPHWFQVDLGVSSDLECAQYLLRSQRVISSGVRTPTAWILECSTDQTSWMVVDQRSGVTWSSPLQSQTFDVTAVSLSSLNISGEAPAVLIDVPRAVDQYGLVITTYAPSLLTGGQPQPAEDALVITTYAPIALVTGFVQPAEDVLVITGYAPSADQSYFLDVGDTALTITTYAPSVLAGAIFQPGVVSLTITGQAPFVGGGEVAQPSEGTLVITGFAPDVLTAFTVQPGTDDLAFTGLAPSAQVSYTIAVGFDALVIQGEAPVAQAGDFHTAQPNTGTLAITGYAPSIEQSYFPDIGDGSLTITGFAPTVVVGEVVSPAPDSLAFTTYAPTLLVQEIVQPGDGSLVITGFAPVVGASYTVIPPVGSLVLSGYVPTPIVSSAEAIPFASLTLTGYAPSLQFQTIVKPGAGALLLTGLAPSLGGEQFISVGLGSLVISGLAPTTVAQDNHVAQPQYGSIVFTGYVPIVQATGDRIITPGVGSIVITPLQPQIQAPMAPHEGVITGYPPTVAVEAFPGRAQLAIIETVKVTVIVHKSQDYQISSDSTKVLGSVRDESTDSYIAVEDHIFRVE